MLLLLYLLCFDFKKCFSKFRKRKLNLCQVITEFCGYSLSLSSRAGNFPTLLQTCPTLSPGSRFPRDLLPCRESMPKHKVFDVFGSSTIIQAEFYPSKNLFSPTQKIVLHRHRAFSHLSISVSIHKDIHNSLVI